MSKYKKSIIILFAVIILMFSANSCKKNNPIDTDDDANCKKDSINNNTLIAYYNFDFNDAKDYSGKGNHGLLQNSFSFVKGIKGNAIHLNGIGVSTSEGGHILLPDLGFNKLNEFTVSMWVKEQDVSYEGGEAYFYFGEYYSGWLGIMNSWGRPRTDLDMRLSFASGGHYVEGNLSNIPALQFKYLEDTWKNIWCFYAFTYNNGQIYAYKNNELIGTIYQKINVSGTQGAIGRHWWGNETSSRLTADIDEVRVYSKALSTLEISKLFEDKVK